MAWADLLSLNNHGANGISNNQTMIKKSLEGINELSKIVYQRNVDKGFYDKEKNIGEMIALLHSELSEALEADRKDIYAHADKEIFDIIDGSPDDISFAQIFKDTIKDTFEDEIADTFIRILDISGYLGIDLENHVAAKLRYNATREHKHGKNY